LHRWILTVGHFPTILEDIVPRDRDQLSLKIPPSALGDTPGAGPEKRKVSAVKLEKRCMGLSQIIFG